jgi:ABC-type transport system substrate-binding protein
MKTFSSTTGTLAIAIILSLCVTLAKGVSFCKLDTMTKEQEQARKYDWVYITSLNRKPETKKPYEYVDWAGNATVNGQQIYFEGSIHKASSTVNSGNPNFRAVYMRNRLADFSSTEIQKPAQFRIIWLLRDWTKGNAGERGVVPRYYLNSGDNCADFNEVVPFQAEDVVAVIVNQLK